MLLSIVYWVVVILSVSSTQNVCKADEPSGSTGYQPRVAVQLYLWLQDRQSRNINYWDDLDAILAEAEAGGARAVETFLDWFNTDERAERAGKLLAKHNLRLAGLYAPGVLYEEQAARKTIDGILIDAGRARKFAPIFIDFNPLPLPKNERKTDEQLATQVRMLNELGKKLAEMNMSMVIHHHDAELKHEAREQRYNVAHVDPKCGGFCLDTHWLYRGGLDPLTLVKETGPKIKAIHLRNSTNGVWDETFGPGDIYYVPSA